MGIGLEQIYGYTAEWTLVYSRYSTELKNLNKGKIPSVELMEVTGNKGSKGYRIILNGNRAPLAPSSFKACVFTDWDDTLSPYTKRKNNYHKELSIQYSSVDADQQKFVTFCEAINKATRVLPSDGRHPERYSPLLEMAAESLAIQKSVDAENYISRLINDDNANERVARDFIKEKVLPLLGDKVYPQTEEDPNKSGVVKMYFREKQPLSADIDFKNRPDNIINSVWSSFENNMLRGNVQSNEIGNFDLDDQTYWIVSTFGITHFQIQKVIEGLQVLQKAGKRIPNEILVYAEGRKRPIIKNIITEFKEDPRFIKPLPTFFLDDSVEQLRLIGDLAIPIFARREGSKRAERNANGSFTELRVETEPLSKIVSS